MRRGRCTARPAGSCGVRAAAGGTDGSTYEERTTMAWTWWRRRRARGLTEEQRVALKRLVAEPRFELIPLKTALAKAEALPSGSAVTVTASPSHGIEATFD